jgi:hypothetical protein
MFLANKLNKGAGSPAALDAQFNYVTMLLHGDGTNGAQNNTFLDSSASPLTITRNGNTTQGSFSPYGSNWSNFFDGTGDYLNTATNSAFAMGTGDFTAELWVYQTSVPGLSMQMLDTRNGGLNGIILAVNTSRVPYFYSGGTDVSSSTALTLNTWNHIAGVRSGSTMTLYLNGVNVGSTSSTDNLTGNNCYIGQSHDFYQATVGYLSNVRLVKGTAVYTAAFTPPTTPLTAITNTSLLTCQSNRFIDTSASPKTITVNGNTSVQRFNPFGTATAYSTSVIGGSGYFDGTGDYLSTPNVAALQPGTSTNPFCIECWISPSVTPASDIAVLGNLKAISYPTNIDGFDILYTSSNKVALRWGYPNYADSGVSASMSLNTWNHVAVCRNSSGSMSCYLNGTRWFNTSSNTSITNATASSFWVGWAGSLSGTTINPFNGYISNVRLVKGSTPYDPTSSTLTVPTAPLTAITNTSLLTNFTNGAIFDNAMQNDLETAGNAQISTSVVKFGTGSLYFDGTGDYLVSPDTLAGNFGTGNFTVEFWWYGGAQAAQYPCQVGTLDAFSSTGAWRVTTYDNSANNFMFIDGVTNYSFSTSNFNNSAWRHVAVTRSGTTVRGFIDGVQQGSSATVSTSFSARRVVVGGQFRDNGFISGYIDDLRITKGYARYTANFTPPTAAFPNTGPY